MLAGCSVVGISSQNVHGMTIAGSRYVYNTYSQNDKASMQHVRKDNWNKWQGYSFYTSDAFIEKCVTITFALNMQPVAGLSW